MQTLQNRLSALLLALLVALFGAACETNVADDDDGESVIVEENEDSGANTESEVEGESEEEDDEAVDPAATPEE